MAKASKFDRVVTSVKGAYKKGKDFYEKHPNIEKAVDMATGVGSTMAMEGAADKFAGSLGKKFAGSFGVKAPKEASVKRAKWNEEAAEQKARNKAIRTNKSDASFKRHAGSTVKSAETGIKTRSIKKSLAGDAERKYGDSKFISNVDPATPNKAANTIRNRAAEAGEAMRKMAKSGKESPDLKALRNKDAVNTKKAKMYKKDSEDTTYATEYRLKDRAKFKKLTTNE